MSEAEQQIVCRQCREMIPFTSGGCPHCGTSIRDRWKWVGVAVVGAILMVSALLGGPIWSFVLLGLFMIGIGGYVLWDQYQRLQEAEERIEQAGRGGTGGETAEAGVEAGTP